MEKTILYPFSINENNSASYTKTLQLAAEMSAKVICFTVVLQEEELDDAYLHLLALNGYYQTTTNDWSTPKIQIEKAIMVGDMKKILRQYLHDENVDVLIKQSPVVALKETVLEDWIKENNYQSKIFSF